jgi:hypothetical protein
MVTGSKFPVQIGSALVVSFCAAEIKDEHISRAKKRMGRKYLFIAELFLFGCSQKAIFHK